MNDDLISEIQTFTLNARAALEDEGGQQLEGIYGWLPDGTFAAAEKYPALAQLDEARETRQRLEQFAADEKAIGVAGKEARTKVIREIAFTWLNRFVAFRLLEERRLIKEAISRLGDSNAYKLWLADDANEAAYTEYQKGGLPINAMGEGPSDFAYRRFLLWQCREQAKDVSVLFDPETLASRLCPRPLVLKQLVADMNADDLAAAWKIGNEETVGWIYQAFNAEELQAAFAGAREQGKKFEPQDIPAVTQLFTIRWVVRFLVQNTLGRLWLELHPDSRLKDSLDYLVPVENRQTRALKLAREISFLDPCCGSMHFGLIAFDIYAEMYREELERAGQEGWPAEASVSSAEDIPASIVTHNIYGIDLDVRAIQLSALTLLLRARTLNPKCAFTDSNLASANIEQLTAGRLEEFIQQARFTHPIYERTLKALAARLKDSENLGSLLRLDRDLEKLVADERKRAETDRQFRLAFPALTSEHFTTREGIEEFFEIIGEQILRHLDTFVRESRSVGQDAGHFVAEAAKGLRFLRIIQHRFDVVTTNPPYLSSRKMNQRLAELMVKEYPEGKSDLYAGFIIRCQELLKEAGLMGMLTMHTFMFIGSYEKLRNRLSKHLLIDTVAHFGGGLFAVGNPGTLQTAAFVLRSERTPEAIQNAKGLYFRLTNETNAESKLTALERALTSLRINESDPHCYICPQADFALIKGEPWVYFVTPSVRNLFRYLPPLAASALPRHGASTTENFRFLRFWWEVGKSRTNWTCNSHGDALASGFKWFPYAKGGALTRWFGNYFSIVNWSAGGAEMKAVINEKRKRYSPNAKGDLWGAWLNSYDYYFQEGIVYSYLSSSNFGARILPKGYIFDVAASAIFSENLDLIISVLNSRVGEYLLSVLNPTLNLPIGDMCRLPLPTVTPQAIPALVKDAIRESMEQYDKSELASEFVRPLASAKEHDSYRQHVAAFEKTLDYEVCLAYGLDSTELDIIDQELSGRIFFDEESDKVDDSTDESSEIIPIGKVQIAESWVSFAFGAVMGRFIIGVPHGLGRGDFDLRRVDEIRKLTHDGVLVSDEGHPQDIVRITLRCLELMLKQEVAYSTVCTVTGGERDAEDLLREWIDRQFWRYHFKLYRKRPVYWPLQSPKKKLTVWVFHERFTKDTLFKLRTEFVEPKVRWLESRIQELKDKVRSTTGRESRNADKEASQLADVLDDVQEFAKRLNGISQRGYTPHIDDGVLLNAAPIWELLPSWPEAKKAWQELEAGKYDWAQQAMEYWPERVKETCKTNKSFAIAHGLA